MYYIDFLSQAEIAKYPEVTSTKVYINKNKQIFHEEGLFSEQIFGPTIDYRCQCGLFNGKIYDGRVCPKCRVKVTSSFSRFVTFGKITLKYRCVHPDAVSFLAKEFGSTVINDIIYGKEFYIVDNKQLVKSTKDDKNSGTGGEFLYNNINRLQFKDKRLKRFIQERREDIFIKYVVVLPPAARNIIVVDGYSVIDDINNYYMLIMKRNDAIKRVALPQKALIADFYEIQHTIMDLVKKIEPKLGKKEGLMRQNLLGKRADFSARSVIVPNPALKLKEAVLPVKMCKELYKFHMISHLIHKKGYATFDAFKEIEEMDEDRAYEILKEVMASSFVVLNRQPTLHRLGMLAFKPIPKKNSSVIEIPALVCPPFNADFDGDQMAVYLPLSESALEEAEYKMLTTKQIISPSSRDITYKPGHDIVLGLYKLTKYEVKDTVEETLHKKITIKELLGRKPDTTVMYKDIKTTVGRVIFNKILREKIEFINEPVTKKKLYILLKDERLRDHLVDILDDIREYGFYITTLYGGSFSVEDFIDEELLKEKEEIKNIFYINKLEELSKKMRSKFEHIPIYDMINSGARGNWDQVRQISLMKGFVTDVSGAVITEPIRHALIEGLTPKEFFAASFGARKGVVDSSLNTANSGYFTRKMIFAASPCVIDTNLDDCSTKNYFYVKITKDIADHLVSRFIYDDELGKEIKVTDGKKYIGKTVKLRSPIYCKGDKGFCRKCVGTFDRNTEQIGILAAQALGEPTTQMTLRTFHTGGVATTTLGYILESFIDKNIELRDKDIYVLEDCYIEKQDKQVFIKFTDNTLIDIEDVNDFIWHVPFNKDIKKNTKIITLKLKNQDIVSDLSLITKLLDNKEVLKEYVDDKVVKLFYKLLDIFKNYSNVDFIYLEVLLSQMSYFNGKLLRHTDAIFPNELKTLSEIPASSSIIQGLAFEGFRRVVNKSLTKLKNKEVITTKNMSILERILMLEF